MQPDWRRVEANGAEQALDILKTQPIDVALLDYNMPGIDGLALADSIKTLFPEMPIALITANIQDDIVARARDIGIAFVSKPITEEGLRGFASGAALRLKGGRDDR